MVGEGARLRWIRALPVLLLVGLVTLGCSNAGPGPSRQDGAQVGSDAEPASPSPSGAELSATTVAQQVADQVGSAGEVTTPAPENSPEDVGVPPINYLGAAAILDRSLSCEEASTSCSAVVEVWPDEAAAQRRSTSLLDEAAGSEPEAHTVAGPVLLRVSGQLDDTAQQQ